MISSRLSLTNIEKTLGSRKILADLAMNHPDAFKAVVDSVKK